MPTSTDLDAAIDAVHHSLTHEGMAGEGATGDEAEIAAPPGFFATLTDRLGVLPWWVISVIAHAILILLFGTFLLADRLLTAVADDLFVQSEFTEPEEPEVDMQKPRDLFRNPVEAPAEVSVEQPVLARDDPEAEVSDHFETDNDMDSATACGDENAFSTVPLGGTGVVGTIGVGGGGPAGVFGFRNGGGRRKCIMRYGGSKQSESAVEAALKWLADHQEADGHWDCAKHGGRSERYDIGVTGLATLAFLGAGYTPTTPSKYREKVKKGVEWLMGQQQDNGAFGGRGGHHGYIHSIGALAMAEAYGMTQDEEIGKSAQKAVDYTVNVHQVPYSGWRYNAKQKGDMSVSGWFIMQIKSAKVAGLVVDGKAFQGALNFVDECTDPETGRVGYTTNRNGTPRRTSIGLVCRQFLGCDPRTDPMLKKEGDYLLEHLPKPFEELKGGKGRADFYYWYYGMLGMFQMGGDHWKKWNGILRDRLIKTQCTAKDGDNNGSWDYENGQGLGGKRAGRVFTTALGALCLEVYYRYLPMYKK